MPVISVYISKEVRAWIDCQPKTFKVSPTVREFLFGLMEKSDAIKKLKRQEEELEILSKYKLRREEDNLRARREKQCQK